MQIGNGSIVRTQPVVGHDLLGLHRGRMNGLLVPAVDLRHSFVFIQHHRRLGPLDIGAFVGVCLFGYGQVVPVVPHPDKLLLTGRGNGLLAKDPLEILIDNEEL